jgi:hypothetical protein
MLEKKTKRFEKMNTRSFLIDFFSDRKNNIKNFCDLLE